MARGKRLRPTFILLVYRACGGAEEKIEDAIDAAIALELIHSATLLHDDIIDGGLLRRGKPSAFARYGFGAHADRRRLSFLPRLRDFAAASRSTWSAPQRRPASSSPKAK